MDVNDIENSLNNRDKKMGFGGDYKICITHMVSQSTVQVLNLNKEAARILFDQLDESNSVNSQFKIALLHNNLQEDFNILPNAFSS